MMYHDFKGCVPQRLNLRFLKSMPLSFHLAVSLAPGFFLNMWTTWATVHVPCLQACCHDSHHGTLTPWDLEANKQRLLCVSCLDNGVSLQQQKHNEEKNSPWKLLLKTTFGLLVQVTKTSLWWINPSALHTQMIWENTSAELSTFDFTRGGESHPNLLDGKAQSGMKVKGQVVLKYVSVLFGVF